MNDSENETFTLTPTKQVEIWMSRSLKHKLIHRKNVISAFLAGKVTLRSFWFGIRYAHCVTFLASAPPNRGYIFVCPEIKSDLDQVYQPN